MSDPVTNAEVEDVLSSIRRLVSEDKRPLQTPKPEPRNDRLVLTPALRVAEDPAPAESAETPAPEETAAATPAPEPRMEGSIAEEASLDAPPEALAQQAPEDSGEENPEAGAPDILAEDYSTDPYNFRDDEDIYGEGDQFAMSDDTDETDFDDRAADTDEAFETASYIGEDFDEDEDEDEDEDAGSGESLSGAAFDAPTGAPTEAPADDDWRESLQEAELPAPEVNRSASLSAKIEALETAIGSIADEWEPDDPGESDYAGTEPETMAWEDDAPEQASEPPKFVHAALFAARREQADRTPEPEAKPQASEPETQTASTRESTLDLTQEEQLIDEETLRDLVSEIVRAELQGALGERITRNVRKLVRREIHRALTAQELE